MGKADSAKIVILAAVYFLAAKFGLSLAFSTEQVTTIWPPTGIALAALLIFGYRIWPGILLGAFAANAITAEPVLTAAGIATSNTLAGLFGAYLLKEKFDFDCNLRRIRDVLALVFAAVFVSTLVSATLGVLNLAVSKLIAWPDVGSVFLTWWMGDLMGILIVAPLILVWSNRELVAFIRRHWIETIAFFGLLLLTVSFIFLQAKPLGTSPIAYMVLPFIVWSGLRLRPIGAASANFLIAIVAVWGTISSSGPFTAHDQIESNLNLLLMYIFVFAVISLLMAASIEERQAMDRDLQFQYYHDQLTELGNRLFFIGEVEQAIRKGKEKNFSFAVFRVDIDRFKTVVDSFAYELADRLLKEAALRLRSLKDKEISLARLGGNEFGMISKEVEDRDEAIVLINKIFGSFKQPFLLLGKEIYVTVSIGVATYPNDGQDMSSLLRNSHAALRRAKDLGGNNCQFYYSTLNAAVPEELVLENDLRRAFDRSELELFYQPQIDLANGQIVKNEALIRWRRPGIGLVTASEFIRAAESTGMIAQIEWLSLKQGIIQTAAWHRQNFKVGLAVNISARQFLEEGLPNYIGQLLAEFGLAGKYLELEITERILLEDSNLVRGLLNKLKKMGVAISIDDFNTGYSSLNYIKQFPFDVLKVDRSFIAGVPDNTQDCAIAESIIKLSHSLGKKVCAEGVENKNQLSFLIKHGCDLAQGYLFSPALPATEQNFAVNYKFA